MTISHFLTFGGPAGVAATLRDWFMDAPAAVLAGLSGVETLDLYIPENSHDPMLDDGAGPLLTAQTGFASLEALEAGIAAPALSEALGDLADGPASACTIAHDAMELKFFPVAGEDRPAPLTAPVSYVVRYHRPADDEAHFVEHYCAHHPPVLGKFPKIRNVMCYLPLDWIDPLGVPRADYLLGNEVVFDSLGDLNAALASDVRHELREDYKTLPPFHGRNTHYAMRRERLWGGTAA